MEFILRLWTIDDLDSLVLYANNYNIGRNMSDVFPHPYKVEHGRAFISLATKNTPPNILAIDISGEVAGGIGIHPQTDIYRKNAELGNWLAEPYWGKGIMTRAILQMVQYGFRHWDINRIYARPFGTNIPLQKALEKAGYILEGKLEKRFTKMDSTWMN